jgi:methylamine dehydrogenase light chain
VNRIDLWMEGRARSVARRAGRRTFLARLGTLILGGSALPLLPVARGDGRANAEEGEPGPRVPFPVENIPGPQGDPKSCDYWRHCAIDGLLCACCGGSPTACPPGTQVAPVTWVGTCRNPADGRDYIISYNDCCGKSFCGRCGCNRNEGERPEYHWYRNNDINWCAGTESQLYHCSLAVVVGQATEAQPEK